MKNKMNFEEPEQEEIPQEELNRMQEEQYETEQFEKKYRRKSIHDFKKMMGGRKSKKFKNK